MEAGLGCMGAGRGWERFGGAGVGGEPRKMQNAECKMVLPDGHQVERCWRTATELRVESRSRQAQKCRVQNAESRKG